MSFEARCPQCVFLSNQLGQPTACLLHVELVADVDGPADHDEPYVFGQVNPTVDRPGPFTLREYIRLSLLRARIQDLLPHADHPQEEISEGLRGARS